MLHRKPSRLARDMLTAAKLLPNPEVDKTVSLKEHMSKHAKSADFSTSIRQPTTPICSQLLSYHSLDSVSD